MENQNTVTLQSQKLKDIASANETSQSAMLLLATRERDARKGMINVQSTKAKLLRSGAKVIDEDYMQFWKNLESAGVGQYIIGRRGNPDRFKCHFSIVEVATAAVEGREPKLVEVETQNPAPRKARAIKKPATPSKKRQRLSSEAKAIEREVMQRVRQALVALR